MKPLAETDPVPSSSSSANAVAQPAPGASGTLTLKDGAPRRRRPAPVAEPTSNLWLQLATAASRHWGWILLAMAVGVVAGITIGRHIWAATYTATAQLVRYDTPDPQLFSPRVINPATLVGMVGSPEVHQRAGARVTPALSNDEVADRVRITPVPTTDLVNVAITAPDAATASTQANIYAEEAVKFTQEMQAADARDAASYLRHQLDTVQQDLTTTNSRFDSLGVAPDGTSTFGASPALQARLDSARLELADLQARYTDQHPLVQIQLARVAALEKQLPAAAAPAAGPAPAATSATTARPVAGDLETLREKSRSIENQRRDLNTRLQITEMLAQNPPGYYRVFSPAAAERAKINNPRVKIALLAAFLGLCGLVAGVLGGITDEALDHHLRTPDDVRRVTQLPVLARLGPIEDMTPEQRASWGFRTWTALQSRLSATPNEGLVCGITSSTAGEGRSVWLKLLAEAATKCGFRAVIITTRPLDDPTDEARSHEGRPAPAAATSAVRFRTRRGGEPKSAEPVLVNETMLSDDLLGDPASAADQMFSAEGTSVVHIPLPGWVWNLEHRKEWLASLDAWGSQENVVVLVELPPASTPEAVLLAQNLPNVVWLSDTKLATALETRRQIETLRLARCNLVGAVMNRSSGTNFNERFARWMPAPALALLALGLWLGLPATGRAEDVVAAKPATFAIVSPAQRADWQQHLTLGPGDELRVSLYGDVTATESTVVVQPDGRLSFLEARDVVAAGLTVDELRTELDRELGNYRRSPRTMVTPVTFRSKKYYMLGLVSQRGAFTLDRPMTVVEAVARARGFETSAASGDVQEMADLSHAFLVRGGQRRPVDFARLFSEGDLSQNIAVEPGDYFYFPPAGLSEVYVLGEVTRPGPAMLTEHSTTLRAVATRGGFTAKAWRNKVLVVRGSLSSPKALVVNLADVLEGRKPDLPLEPHDIVYVSAKPWWKAEELLDDAASAFTQSFIVYWSSDQILPIVPIQ